MAEPVTFDHMNSRMMGDSDVGTLPTYIDRTSGFTISCWELSAEEQVEVLQTGKVWLTVWGRHTPVNISGTTPFIEVKD